MGAKATPFAILATALAAGIAAAAIALIVALAQPWLGLSLTADAGAQHVVVEHAFAEGAADGIAPGTIITAIGGISVEPDDLIEEPDVAVDYPALQRFFDRQAELAEAIRAPTVTIATAAAHEPVVVVPMPSRPLSSLPLVFWIQIAAGLVCLMIGFWVWSIRRNELSTALLAIAGLGIPISAFPAAIYSSRQLAIDGQIFRALSSLNYLGSLTFGVAMASLFLIYPKRLVPARMLLASPFVFLAIWSLDTMQSLFTGPVQGRHLPIVVLMALILAGGVWQHKSSRHDPAARAIVRWFALSVLLCAGTFVVVVLAPNLFGIRSTVSQGYAFVLFALLFIGVAAGVARYKLFEVERWAFTLLYYFGAVALLVMIDAVLIYAIAMERPAAFGVSLLVVGLLYLPARDWASKRLTRRRTIDRGEIFRRLVDAAMGSDADYRQARWENTLRDVFNPLQIATASPMRSERPTLSENGLALRVPSVAGLPDFELRYAHSGRRLFTRDDERLAAELGAILDHAIASHDAHEKGAAVERTRIARDMHDNIGAQLLSALHSDKRERKDELIRETITDLRDIVNNASRGRRTLEEILADIQAEIGERLALAGIQLTWRQSLASAQRALEPNVAHALRSILRETVSNVIKHSGASGFAVHIEASAQRVLISMRDDGVGLSDERMGNGHGLANIDARVQALGGTMSIADASPGLQVTVDAPLDRALR